MRCRGVLRHGPVERHVLAGANLKGGAVGLHGLFQALGAALARAEDRKCGAEVVLRRGPAERNALAGANLKGGAVGLHGLFQALGVARARAKVVSAMPSAKCRSARCSESPVV